jgi:hypothetical protein
MVQAFPSASECQAAISSALVPDQYPAVVRAGDNSLLGGLPIVVFND